MLLAQVYQNLIQNALKFTGDAPPRIHLTAEAGDDYWTLGVRDEGIGLEPESAAQIFAPFQRLHEADQYEGSGIGLTICRTTVERHGGVIWVESELGRGAHFKFTLPRCAPASTAEPPARDVVGAS
jgi:signal transduction histidine kinase